MLHCSKRRPHRITASARASSDSGIVGPSDLGGFEIDHRFKFRRLLDGNIPRDGARAVCDEAPVFRYFR